MDEAENNFYDAGNENLTINYQLILSINFPTFIPLLFLRAAF
jgi:hypothetical protein